MFKRTLNSFYMCLMELFRMILNSSFKVLTKNWVWNGKRQSLECSGQIFVQLSLTSPQLSIHPSPCCWLHASLSFLRHARAHTCTYIQAHAHTQLPPEVKSGQSPGSKCFLLNVLLMMSSAWAVLTSVHQYLMITGAGPSLICSLSTVQLVHVWRDVWQKSYQLVGLNKGSGLITLSWMCFCSSVVREKLTSSF